MPQLIAMVIVVVGAMIYMFQTFGGTGDKIEGIAQKTSAITEINNIKNGLKLAARSGHIKATVTTDGEESNNLSGLGKLSYFASQINEQLKATLAVNAALTNRYYAISFGGSADDAKTGGKPAMLIKLVAVKDTKPGIFVDFSQGSLKESAAFLESQIDKDLENVATIERKGKSVSSAGAPTLGGTKNDGKFIVYFKDFGTNEYVK